MLIDSHVNLHAPQFDDDRDAVIARARAAGVELMVEISDKLSTFEATHALAMAHDDIWCTVGAHPHEAKDHAQMTADDLIEMEQTVPAGTGFRSDHFWVRVRASQGETSQQEAALIQRGKDADGAIRVAAVERWRGAAVPPDAPPFAPPAS